MPPMPDALDRKGAGISADADADPAVVGSNVVHAIGSDLAKFRDLEVVHPHRFGVPLRRSSRPLFLKSPTSSFFLVSTEIAGSPAAIAARTVALTCSNWALRSGWLLPSRVLRLAWQP